MRRMAGGMGKGEFDKEGVMARKKYVYWQDDDMWLGYLEEFPDYMTQGETLDELKENLIDIYDELMR